MSDLDGEKPIPISKLINLSELERKINKIFSTDFKIIDVDEFKVEIESCDYEGIDITDKVVEGGKINIEAGKNLNDFVGRDPAFGKPKNLTCKFKIAGETITQILPEYNGLLRDINYSLVPLWCNQQPIRLFPHDFYDKGDFNTVLRSIPFKYKKKIKELNVGPKWNGIWAPPPNPLKGGTNLVLGDIKLDTEDVVYFPPIEGSHGSELERLFRFLLTIKCQQSLVLPKDTRFGYLVATLCSSKNIIWV